MIMRADRERQSTVEVLDWPRFFRDWRWKPGEHVTIIGPNGQGKSTLACALETKRARIAKLTSKPRDPLFEELVRRGWTRVQRWPRATADDSQGRRRILLWVPTATITQVPRTARVFREALEAMMKEGGWVCDIDELLFAADPHWLALGKQFELMWQQARTLGVSLLVCSQRSAHIPLLAYDQVEHLFVFRENDLVGADRIGMMAGLDRFEVRDVVRGLDRFEVLYIGVRNGRLVRTMAPVIV